MATTIKNRNFASTSLAAASIPKADVYENCNFSQRNRNIPLFPGDPTPRTFIRCNMVNAVPPAGSEMIDCNTADILYTGNPGEPNQLRVFGRRGRNGDYEEFPAPIDIDERTP
ncbi:MAG: hypothetical protein ACO3FE_23480 [Planctomycetaceae bacterium]